MTFGMNTTHGNQVVFDLLNRIKLSGKQDRDAIKMLYDHLDHLSDSSKFSESSDNNVKKLAVEWLEQNKIIKPKLYNYIDI
jgi:hypothetical protein